MAIVCTRTALSGAGEDIQNNAKYVAVGAATGSLYYNWSTSLTMQDKIISALAAGAMGAIIAWGVGIGVQVATQKCSTS